MTLTVSILQLQKQHKPQTNLTGPTTESVKLYKEINKVTLRVETKKTVHDRLLTVPEAAELAAMKVNTMYTLCQRQVLPSVKIGKMRRIKEADLVAWINSNAVQAKTAK
jgi:excisionase family DNA binding protein